MASKKWIQAEVQIPKSYSAEERLAIAADIVKFIRQRTKQGKDVDGDTFKPNYSKAYRESLDFKIAGKSGSTPNLKLSGDMLAALRLIDHKKGKLVVGYKPGDPEAGRAEGNNRGTYGDLSRRPTPREFIGISKDDLRDKILAKYPLDNDRRRERQTGKTLGSKLASEALVEFEDDIEE